MSDNGSPNNVQQKPEDAGATEHLNIKVTDNNNEVFFKIKRSTALGKLMNAFCDRQGKNVNSVRFLFDGQRVTAQDTPDTVRSTRSFQLKRRKHATLLLDPLLTSNSSTCRTATHSKYIRSRLVARGSQVWRFELRSSVLSIPHLTAPVLYSPTSRLREITRNTHGFSGVKEGTKRKVFYS